MKKACLTWGITVKISQEAHERFRPGELGEICSIWQVTTDENAMALGEPVGSRIYGVEFGDGMILEIPERFLEKY